MLVLSRKPQQAIHIGRNIRVVILKSTNGKVTIGIEAPVEIPISRDEITDPVPHPESLSLVSTHYE
jgi:carbon storage regulator